MDLPKWEEELRKISEFFLVFVPGNVLHGRHKETQERYLVVFTSEEKAKEYLKGRSILESVAKIRSADSGLLRDFSKGIGMRKIVIDPTSDPEEELRWIYFADKKN